MAANADRPNVLDAIVAATRRRVEVAKANVPMSSLVTRAGQARPRGQAFREALAAAGRVNVIAECKRRSPSRGVLRHDYDPVAIARGYEQAGAAAISVLTEPGFFDGSLDHLAAVRDAVTCPLLRKDFIVDDYQLLEARAAGADAVLLIVAALDPRALRHLHEQATALDLAVLVEVHDVVEVRVALAAGATIIGVNNRNLRTLDVDVHASRDIARVLPTDIIAVSESGLKSADDVREFGALGYRAFLIGERFMTAEDPGAALHGLIGRGVLGGSGVGVSACS
jgi:indole-3-glycerol phosphate synthase